MPVPAALRRLPPRLGTLVSKGNLDAARGIVDRGGVERTVFVRSAVGGDVADRRGERRRCWAILDEAGRLAEGFCTCRPTAQSKDLCHHLAAVLLASTDTADDGTLLLGTAAFEASLAGILGRAAFEERAGASAVVGRVAGDDGERVLTTAGVDGSLLVRLVLRGGMTLPERTLAAAWSRLGVAGGPMGDVAREALESVLRKKTVTAEEEKFAAAGFSTPRQAWERSFWSALAAGLFDLIRGDLSSVRVVEREGRLWLSARIVEEDDRFRLLLPRRSVEPILAGAGGRRLFERSGIEVRPGGLTTSFRVSVAESGGLVFDPVLVVAGPGGETFDRVAFEERRYGSYFLLPGSAGLASRPTEPPFFATSAPGAQLRLDFGGGWSPSPAGMSIDARTEIPAAELFGFVERHRAELARIPEPLAPEFVRRAEPLPLSGDVEIRAEAEDERGLALDVRFDAGDESIPLGEILAARRARRPFLVRGRKWLLVDDARFGWIDRLGKGVVEEGDGTCRLRLAPIAIVRLLAELPAGTRIEGALAQRVRGLARLESDVTMPAGATDPLGLFDYQKNGLAWLWFLWRNGFGGLLCDDMGLGKTHQAMALIAAARAASPTPLRILVACPASLVDHWIEKLGRFVPDVPARPHLGAGRALSARDEIVVSSYGTLRNDAALFSEWNADLFVLDEIQSIKNRSTSTFQALASIPRGVALGLTGTPVENGVAELRNLVDFVLPGYLPGEADFARRFADPIEAGDPEARDRLARLVHPFVLRRTKSQVLPDLPSKLVDRRLCGLTAEQQELYRDVLSRRGRPLLERIRGSSSIPYVHVFAVLSRLKQICDHTALVADGGNALADPDVGSSGKWDAFCEILDEALGSGLKVVVFSQYVRMLALIEAHLARIGVGFATIKGDTRHRGEMVARFRDDPACRVFTASLRAGGLGIDLTAASVVVHYDRWWNQAREDQATDRVHRLGQTRGVQVVQLITRGTIEEKIDAIIAAKDRLARGLVREDDPSLAKQFSREELEELLGD